MEQSPFENLKRITRLRYEEYGRTFENGFKINHKDSSVTIEKRIKTREEIDFDKKKKIALQRNTILPIRLLRSSRFCRNPTKTT